MQIGQVAEMFGINPSALRYYERQGLLTDIRRRSGVRDFSNTDAQRIGFIQLAQSAGFTIAEIRNLLHGFGDAKPSAGWRLAAEQKRADLAKIIEDTQQMTRVLGRLLDCDCPSLEVCGDIHTKSQKRRRQQSVDLLSPDG